MIATLSHVSWGADEISGNVIAEVGMTEWVSIYGESTAAVADGHDRVGEDIGVLARWVMVRVMTTLPRAVHELVVVGRKGTSLGYDSAVVRESFRGGDVGLIVFLWTAVGSSFGGHGVVIKQNERSAVCSMCLLRKTQRCKGQLLAA